MKLELKHLSAYLPYGVKIKFDTTKRVKFHTMSISNINDVLIYTKNYKPILRPLSDLTKEITVNGETFVPLQYLSININWYGLEQWKSDHKLMNVEEYNNLLSWHFDVFGLIEQGLAININTL